MKNQDLQQLLNSTFQRKQKSHPSYSKAALARDLGVSATFISSMFNGKKLPPKDKIEKIAYLLEMDNHERSLFFKIVLLPESLPGSLESLIQNKGVNPNKGRKEIVPDNKFGILSNWWNLALLEGFSLKEPLNNPEALQKRLNLTDQQMQEALAGFRYLGLIDETSGLIKKSEQHTYIPTGRSKAEVRNFHDQMISKSRVELKKTEPQDFSRRYITGATFALNSAQLEQLKSIIANFLNEVTQTGGSGLCDEVYQCNVQLFPLTSSEKPDPSKS